MLALTAIASAAHGYYCNYRLNTYCELFLLLTSHDLTVSTFKYVVLIAHAILFDFNIREVFDDFSSGDLSELPLLIRFSINKVIGTEHCPTRLQQCYI